MFRKKYMLTSWIAWMLRKVEKLKKFVFWNRCATWQCWCKFFIFFQKYAICDFWRTCKFCMFFLKSQVFHKKCYLSKYAVVGCKSMETFGCMSMPFGCMYAATFGCMYAVVGCKVCGDVWVHVCGCWVQVS